MEETISKINTKIGTVAIHSGSFHSDDVFAIAALRMIDPDLKVIRTRDNDKLQSADMRVDVGNVYDHKTKDYDHHQKGGAGERENGVPYAAVGLIWKHYGAEISGSPKYVSIIDRMLIQKIDSVDTGHADYDLMDPKLPYPLNLVIHCFDPSWQDENQDYDTAFEEAVKLATRILSSVIKKIQGRDLAKEIVRKAISKSDNKAYIVLEKYCPWQETTISESDVNFIIFKGNEGNWIIKTIPVKIGIRSNDRKQFPSEWAGLRLAELSKITGVEDAVFCHNARFICVAKTLDAAKRLAILASDY